MPKKLQPVKEVKINPWALFLWIFIFALVFWIIGSFFRHYPSIQGVL